MMAALAELAAGGSQQQWRIEFEVEDQPFWWDNNLGDADVRRMFGAVPPNAQVRPSGAKTTKGRGRGLHVRCGPAERPGRTDLGHTLSRLFMTHGPRWP